MRLIMDKYGNPAAPVIYRLEKGGEDLAAASIEQVPVGAMYFDGVWFEKRAPYPSNVPYWAADEDYWLNKKYGSGVRYAGD